MLLCGECNFVADYGYGSQMQNVGISPQPGAPLPYALAPFNPPNLLGGK